MRTKNYNNAPRAYTQNPIVTQKYMQFVLNCIKSGAESNGKLTKARLASILYLTDFAWYYLHSSCISGASYYKQHEGPVSDVFNAALRKLENNGLIADKRHGDSFYLFPARRNILTDRLSMDELKLIKSIGMAWHGKSDNELTDFVHGQLPYQVSRKGEIIPYVLISQEEPIRACGMAIV